jgi:predicted transcriptional regulator
MDTANGANNDWLKVLSQLDTDIIPEGYERPEVIAKKMSRSLKVAKSILKSAHDDGLVKRERVRVNGNSCYVYKTKNPS